MAETTRSLLSRAQTFMRFFLRQRRALPQIKKSLVSPDPSASLLIDGSESRWQPSGRRVSRGERFRLTARGHHWIAKPLGLVIEPQATLWMRIGQEPIRKVLEPDASYEAWADGEIQVLSKSLSEWVDSNGALLPGSRKAQQPGISVAITTTEESPTQPNRLGEWAHLWRIGEGRIFTVDGGAIKVSTHADVGILRKEVGLPLTDASRISWEWLVEMLPSEFAEDLPITHDYLSLAVEFDNGRDLTYLWSAELPAGHAFRCPLGWWCEREMHFVVRSGREGLGRWQSEDRALALDYREAIDGELPQRIVAIWLIANSVFQRGTGTAIFRNISLVAQ